MGNIIFRAPKPIDENVLNNKLRSKIKEYGLESLSFDKSNINENELFNLSMIGYSIPTKSNKKYKSFIKKIVKKCTSFIYTKIIKDQNVYNAEVAKYIIEIEDLIKNQQKEIDTLKNEIRKSKK